jgi:formate dehydrogenase subunit gamma
MADAPIVRAAALLLATLGILAASGAYAADQVSTPAPNGQNASPAAEAQRQAEQPLNNAPVWRDVRSGAPQVTQVRGRETNVLIQPQGETWRSLRVPVVFWGGMPMDRYAHWLLAITWVTLALTGLVLSLGKSVLLPVIGYTLFSWLAVVAKTLHNFVGPILIIAVPFLFIRFVRDNGIGWDDVKWFLNIAGYFKGHEHPSGRFNAGEKVVFWGLLVILSTILVGSGLVLVFPNFDQTRSTMQIANVVHMLAAYVAIALALVHIYLGTFGMVDAYRAMRYGYVDESWAKHHHLRWYQDVAAGRARQHFADPDAVAPPPAQPRTRPA